jgi:hypothetical protein
LCRPLLLEKGLAEDKNDAALNSYSSVQQGDKMSCPLLALWIGVAINDISRLDLGLKKNLRYSRCQPEGDEFTCAPDQESRLQSQQNLLFLGGEMV